MRLLACGAALGWLLACGHYGPPVRAGDSEGLAPAEAAECEEDDESEQEPRP